MAPQSVLDRRTDRHRTGWLLAVAVCGMSLGQVQGRAQVPEAPDAGRRAVIITLHGDITDITVDSIGRRIDEAVERGAEVIVLELDTPGGLVTSSIAIADLLRSLGDVTTVAWVRPDAYSGGALVAVACDEIVMSRSSRIGDSQVIIGGPEGVTAVPDELKPKIYTPVLHDFRTSAKLNGYSQVLCDAFVDPDLEVWWLENTETGDREFVFADEKDRRLGGDGGGGPAIDWQDGEDSEGGPGWRLVEEYYDIILEEDLPVSQPVVPSGELLQMSPAEAHAYGFSQGVVSDETELSAHYELGEVVRLNPLWSESLAHWLTSMPVRAFLLIVVFLAAYVEFHTPGVGVAGLVALIALAVFVGAPYVAGFATIWEILLLVVGVVLVLLEVLVIPGFGVAGITGLMCIVTGLVATFIPEQPGRSVPNLFPPLPATVEGLKLALIALVSSLVASVAGMIMLSRFMPDTVVFRKLAPPNPMPTEVLVDDPYRGAAHVGDLGRTESALHPAGKARFGSVLVDVVAQGEFIDPGTTVEVVERRGNRVVVRTARS